MAQKNLNPTMDEIYILCKFDGILGNIQLKIIVIPIMLAHFCLM